MTDFPAYIPTRNVVVSASHLLVSADPVCAKITVKASASLVWRATGERFPNAPRTFTTTPGGLATIPLPRTDVDGWGLDGGYVIDVSADGAYSHTYTIEVLFLDEQNNALNTPKKVIGPFVVPDGTGDLNLADAMPTSTLAGDVVSILSLPGGSAGTVTSVNTITPDGTGDVTLGYSDVGAASAAQGAKADAALPAASLDTSVDALVSDPGSAMSAALSSTYAPSETAANRVDRLGTANLTGIPGFTVMGVNWGPFNTSTPAYLTAWGSEWDDTVSDLNIDRVAQLGANTVRIMGLYAAYAANPAQFMTRATRVIERARTNHLKVIFALLNNAKAGEEIIGTDAPTLAGYQAYVNDIVGQYAGDGVILGWDLGNEMAAAGDTSKLTILAAVASYVHAVDPDAKVTASLRTPSPLDAAAVESFVDFQDVHFYLEPGPSGFSTHNILDKLSWVTAKPILVSEIGANKNIAGNGPQISGLYTHPAYYAAFRRYALHPQCMGVIVHKIADSVVTDNKYGMYDGPTSGASIRLAAQEFARYPSERLTVVNDALRYRAHPVVADNFARPASATVVGTSPIGGAPTQTLGTWGISASRKLYVSAHAGARDLLTWETNSTDIIAEVEFEPYVAGLAKLGFVLRYADTSNWLICLYDNTSGASGIRFYQSVAGAVTDITPPATPGGATGAMLPMTANAYGRLKVILNGQELGIYFHERLLGYTTTLPTSTLGNTKHGLFMAPTDQGSTFRRVRFSVPSITY